MSIKPITRPDFTLNVIKIFSIPELYASVKSEIPAGNRVQILYESGEWYYLRFGETEGWCKKDSIIILK